MDDLQSAVRLFVAVNFLVIGVSHIVAPRAWAEFFILVRAQGRAGAFAIGFMALSFGSIIVALHNVWSGPALVVTLIGWAQVVKAFVYFAAPEFALKRLETISLERAWIFIAGGAVLAAVGAVIAAACFGLLKS